MNSQLQCIGSERLEAFLEGQLSAVEDQAIRKHLQECNACYDCFSSLERLPKRLSEVGWELTHALVAAGSESAEFHGSFEDDLRLDFLEPSDNPQSKGRLNKYEVTEIIGYGGMGIVLRGIDTKLNRIVAIKVMSRKLVVIPEAKERFRSEAELLARFNHPNVVPIHDSGEFHDPQVGDRPYFVMQIVPGITLHDKIHSEGALNTMEVLRIGACIAAALAEIHSKGVVHRDIKPANVLFRSADGDDAVCIADFGLAYDTTAADLAPDIGIVGTPNYMAPEQVRRGSIDHRADLFSLGSVLFAMCTGHAPFRATSTSAVYRRVVEDSLGMMLRSNSRVPRWLIEIINKLMAKDPGDRFQTAEEVARLLKERLRWLHIRRAAKVVVPLAFMLALILGFAFDRLYLNMGTLAVAAEQDEIEISIDGEKRIGISGDGPVRIKLKSGNHKIEIYQGSKLVETKEIEIGRGTVEGLNVQLGDFIVQSTGHKYVSLAAAVAAANHGDTVEVRGNGPFFSGPIEVSGRDLVIRAGQGYHPSIRLQPDAAEVAVPLLSTDSRLVLEGLDLRRESKNDVESYVVHSKNADLYAANCRFTLKPKMDCVHANNSPNCLLVNCVFVGGHGISWHPPEGGRLLLRNCLQVGRSAVHIHYSSPDLADVRLELSGNTLVGNESLKLFLDVQPPAQLPGANRAITIVSESNVFDTSDALFKVTEKCELRGNPALTRDDAETLIKRLVAWQDANDLYSVGRFYLDVWGWQPAKQLADWREYWNITESSSKAGAASYRGENVRSLIGGDADAVHPLDLVVSADSISAASSRPGILAEEVGPGTPYEGWQQNRQKYTQWLRLTRQQPLAGIRVGFVVGTSNFHHQDYCDVLPSFADRGADVRLLAPRTGEAASSKGKRFKVDLAIQEENVAELSKELDAILVCGGGGRREYTMPPLSALERLAHELLKTGYVMGVGDGVEVLALLHVLDGREATSHAHNRLVIEENGGRYPDILKGADGRDKPAKAVITSQRVITAWHALYANALAHELSEAVLNDDLATIFRETR